MRRSGLNYIFRQADYLLDEVVELEAKGETVYVPRNPREFNTKMPWDYCYRKCIRMECPYAANYWKVNVEQPCNFVMNRGDKVSDHVDGDCPIVGYPDEHIATGSGPSTGFGGGPRVPKQPQVTKGPGAAATNHEDQSAGKSKQDKNGYYTVNKKVTKFAKLSITRDGKTRVLTNRCINATNASWIAMVPVPKNVARRLQRARSHDKPK